MLALIVLVIGVALRVHYFIVQQYLLQLLIGVSIVILAWSLTMSLLKKGSQTYKDPLAYAIVVAVLCGFNYESDAVTG